MGGIEFRTMKQDSGDGRTAVKRKVEAIVEAGGDVRQRVASLIADAAEQFQAGGESLVGLARSAMDGAIAALHKSVPQDPDSVLAQVVDGIGDGLSVTAQATKLALREAAAGGEHFAKKDLTNLADDLDQLGRMFVETIGDAAKGAKANVASEARALGKHAQHTFDRIKPSIDSALLAARQDPIKLGKEAVQSGVTASRLAAGDLFSAIGKSMQQAADHLRGDRKE